MTVITEYHNASQFSLVDNGALKIMVSASFVLVISTAINTMAIVSLN